MTSTVFSCEINELIYHGKSYVHYKCKPRELSVLLIRNNLVRIRISVFHVVPDPDPGSYPLYVKQAWPHLQSRSRFFCSGVLRSGTSLSPSGIPRLFLRLVTTSSSSLLSSSLFSTYNCCRTGTPSVICCRTGSPILSSTVLRLDFIVVRTAAESIRLQPAVSSLSTTPIWGSSAVKRFRRENPPPPPGRLSLFNADIPGRPPFAAFSAVRLKASDGGGGRGLCCCPRTGESSASLPENVVSLNGCRRRRLLFRETLLKIKIVLFFLFLNSVVKT